jgi:hypothetical protein
VVVELGKLAALPGHVAEAVVADGAADRLGRAAEGRGDVGVGAAATELLLEPAPVIERSWSGVGVVGRGCWRVGGVLG